MPDIFSLQNYFPAALPDFAAVFSYKNYFLNFYAIPNFVAGFFVLSLGIFVLLKERAKSNVLFFLFCFLVFGWFFIRAAIYLSADETVALFWSRAGFIFIPPLTPLASHYLFSLFKIDTKYKKILLVNYFLMISTAIVNLSPFSRYFIAGVNKYWWGYYPLAGPAGYVFLPIYLLIIAGFIFFSILHYRRITVPLKKKQMLYILIAVFIAATSVIDYAPLFGYAVFPIGYLPFSVFVALNAYAVLHYKAFSLIPQIATENIIATITDSIILINKDKKIEYANPAALAMLGYSQSELIGKNMEEMVSQARARGPEGWRELMERGKLIDPNAKFFAKGKREVPVKLFLSAIKDENGEFLGIVCVSQDMSDVQNLIIELTQKTSELEKSKGTLEAKEKELQEKVAALERFKKIIKGES